MEHWSTTWRSAFIGTILFAIALAIGVHFVSSQLYQFVVICVANIFAVCLTFAWVENALRAATVRRDRYAWLLIGLSALAFGAMNGVWLTSALINGSLPRLSYGELLIVLSFVLLWAGLLLRAGQLPRDLPGRLMILLDVLIALGAALIVAMHLSFPSALLDNGLPSLNLTIGLACPTLTLITLVFVILLSFHVIPREQHGPRSLLVLAIGLLLLADNWFGYGLFIDRNFHGLLISVMWPVGILLFGVAARWEADYYRLTATRPHEPDPYPALVGTLVPVGLVLAAITLSIISIFEQASITRERLFVFLGSLAILIVLTMLRQTLAFLQTRQLYVKISAAYNEMARNAATDPLTGLANHRYFMGRLEREVHRALRYKRPLAFIFADLDFFKDINDSYGHFLGDQVLLAVAKSLRMQVRDTDIVARYGGEEFVVLLPETTLEQATLLAERLRNGITEIDFRFPHGDTRCLTMSCGVSAIPETSNTTQSLLAHADQAMYAAKQAGRNRVLTANLREGQLQPTETSA